MKSFLQGKKSLDLVSLRPVSGPRSSHAATREPIRSGAPGGDHLHAPGNASVEVIKEGDKVVRLIVTCGCGERVEVECLYPVGA